MVNVTKHGVILDKTEFGFEHRGVLNPAAYREGDFVHLFYRAVSSANISSIGYCKLKGPLHMESRSDIPVLYPQSPSESQGVEDPRITRIDGLYYLTYTAYDGVNALGALATSTDLVHFEKRGIITPEITYDEFKQLAECKGCINEKYMRFNNRDYLHAQSDQRILLWDKNVMFFPKRIDGKLFFMHRIRPDIQIAAIDELSDLNKLYWEQYLLHLDHNILLTPKYEHEVSYIGGGCPPIETEHGWLMIYHGVHDTVKGYVYSACASLLDLKDPRKEIARLPYPLFKPQHDWELKGEVNNVCFPTGAVLFDDELYIYYGAADERIACASMSLNSLLSELLMNTLNYEK